MTSLSENTAAFSPWAILPKRQQDILLAIDPMKTLRVRNGWLIRGEKFSKGTVDALQGRRLVTERIVNGRERLVLTQAGRLAAERLQDHRREKGQ